MILSVRSNIEIINTGSEVFEGAVCMHPLLVCEIRIFPTRPRWHDGKKKVLRH